MVSPAFLFNNHGWCMKGIVIKGYGLFYTVKYNNQHINCTLRGILRKKLDNKRFSNPIADLAAAANYQCQPAFDWDNFHLQRQHVS